MPQGEGRSLPAFKPLAGGEMAERVRAFDWERTPLGPRTAWSPSLTLAVDMLLATAFPMALRWGPDLILIYNDAYAPSLRDRHPEALGRPLTRREDAFRARLFEIHHEIMAGTSAGYAVDRLPLRVRREGAGGARVGHFTVAYSPVPDPTAATGVGGVLVTAVEVTGAVETEKILRDTQARYDRALDAARGVGAWEWDIQADTLYCDARYAQFHGIDPTLAAQGLPIEAFIHAVHPDDRERVQAHTQAVTAAGGEFVDEYRLVQPDGAIRWVTARGHSYLDAAGRPGRSAGVVLDITDRKAMEARLQAARVDRDIALQAAGMGRWDHDPSSGRRYWDRRSCEMFGVPEPGPRDFEGFLERVHPDDVEAVTAAIAAATDPAGPGVMTLQYRILRGDTGELRWLEVFGRAYFEGGACVRFVGVGSDVTERKRAELHLQLLVNELNHRVKNSLATIQAIAAQTFHAARSLPAAQEAFTARIVALSEAHDILTRENWEGADLLDVVARLKALHGGEGRFAVEGPSVRLAPRAALSLSMALHELATNAVKYGALTSPHGQVSLGWSVAPAQDGRPSRLTLTWTERGGPPVKAPSLRGFGSRLIERGLAAELAGEARIDFRPEGVVCTITATLES